jgi:hypothetical protein
MAERPVLANRTEAGVLGCLQRGEPLGTLRQEKIDPSLGHLKGSLLGFGFM